MENREEIVKILQVVRHTTSDIEKQADRICALYGVSKQRELLIAFTESITTWQYECDSAENIVDEFISNSNL
jgi:hypothetical protein